MTGSTHRVSDLAGLGQLPGDADGRCVCSLTKPLGFPVEGGKGLLRKIPGFAQGIFSILRNQDCPNRDSSNPCVPLKNT